MFEKFGEMESYTELDTLAKNLWKEGDKKSLKNLCEENGLDYADMEDAAEDGITLWVTPMMAAMGKLKVEEKALKPQGIMNDWISYIRTQVVEDPKMQISVRKKAKTLTGCIGAILKWSFDHQWEVPQEIKKASGVSAGRVTLGEPDMGQAKKIIREYYGGLS
jgi:hypothetical protein